MRETVKVNRVHLGMVDGYSDKELNEEFEGKFQGILVELLKQALNEHTKKKQTACVWWEIWQHEFFTKCVRLDKE